MAEQSRELYLLSGSQTPQELEQQINRILARMSDRLDQMEGLRGNPRFYKNILEVIGGGLIPGQVLKATATERAEISTLDVSEVANAAPSIDGGPAQIDLSQSLISMVDHDDYLIHQFPAQWLETNSETFMFATQENINIWNPAEIPLLDFLSWDYSAVKTSFAYRAGRIQYSTGLTTGVVDVAAGTVAHATATGTNYVSVTSSGTVVCTTTAFSVGACPLYIYTTSGGVISATPSDRRTWLKVPTEIAIGRLYETVDSTNPATSLGYGTWSLFGVGRVTVCLDSGDTDFDTVEETGGEKAHALTAAEGPTHDHPEIIPNGIAGAGTGEYGSFPVAESDGAEGSNGLLTGTSGSGDPHNTLPPYIVVYRWKRTA
ncbi:MAG: phage baseplate protein [Desulfuromonadaceae bacterium]